ncbi:hypothetical protein ACSNN7_24225 [Micromonospora sp. URMC 105]|uniref:hypothetical protein n=1 Tax=Micromonospora sp. URMC 105 TaxID=3423413 RepID=UPI003F1E1CB1
MNAHRMDQETVERLLGSPVVDPHDGPEPLVRLLTAVRAAPHPTELRGESAAMQAFRTARAGAARPTRTARAGAERPTPRPARPRFLAQLAGLKLALAGLAVAASGGIALAAATGTLPGPLHRDDPAPPTASTVPHDSPSPTAGRDGSGAPSGVESRRPSPAASVLGLCHAYRAGAAENPGRALDNPAFADLIARAGGRNQVPGYCERVVRGTGAPVPPTADRSDPAPPTADRPDPATRRPDARPSGAGRTASTPGGKPTAPGGTARPGPPTPR